MSRPILPGSGASIPTLHKVLPGMERDIDLLFIGSLNAAVWEERNRWLERIAPPVEPL